MIPQVQSALNGWEDPITFYKVTQTIVNALNVETQTPIFFQGMVQPLNEKQLQIKPIGERAWQWYMVHSHTEIAIDVGDKIIYNGEIYKVMNKAPWNPYGYYYYEIVKNFEA